MRRKSIGQVLKGLGPGPAAEPSETPRKRIGGYGSRLAGSEPVRVAGSRPQGPVGQVSRLGPGPPGLGARLQKPSNAPQADWGLGSRLAGSQPGGIQGSGACGPGLQGAWGPGPQGLGPGPPRGWGLFPTKTTKPLKLRFFANLLVGGLRKTSAETAASEVGTWRETKPGYPPYPPPPHAPPHIWGCEKKRVFTLSAFGNHPTRPPRSADFVR